MPKTKENIDPNKTKTNPITSLESAKRIGILRRSEKDGLPKTPKKFSLNSFAKNDDAIQKGDDHQDKPSQISEKISELTTPILSMIEQELALTVPPSMQSLRCNSLQQKSITTASTKSSSMCTKSTRSTKCRRKSIPYWLKPTPVHPYPYNFIMAVRKKLESITHAAAKRPLENAPTLHSKETPVRPKHFRPKNTFRQNLANTKVNPQLRSQEMLASLDAIPRLQMPTEQPFSNKTAAQCSTENQWKNISQSTSDLNTNLSSITLHISGSNTTSDFSSLLSDGKRNLKEPAKCEIVKPAEDTDESQGTMSVSSAIFSQSSPEKRKTFPVEPVPLSTANIDHLQVSMKHNPVSSMPFVTLERGTNETDRKDPRKMWQHQTEPDKNRASSRQNADELNQTNILQMLETFNKSLSQVISVNKQLHTALSNQAPPPPQALTSQSSGPSEQLAFNEYSKTFQSTLNRTEDNSAVSTEKHVYSSEFDSPEITNNHQISYQSTMKSNSIYSHSNRCKSPRMKLDDEQTIHSENQHSNNSQSIRSTHAQRQSLKSNSDTEIVSSRRSQLSMTKSSASVAELIESARASSSQPTSNNSSSKTVPSEINETASDSVGDKTITPENTDDAVDITRKANSSLEPSSIVSIENSSVDTVLASPGKNESQCTTIQMQPEEMVSTRDDQFSVKSSAKRTLKSAAIAQPMPPSDLNTSMGSEIFAMFNQTDMEFSIMSMNDNHTIISEGNVSYSSIGMVS